jgi:mannose-6-phosphate isomerase
MSEIFPKQKRVGPRDWGDETLLVVAGGKYTMKKLFIRAGCKGGLQYHRKKDEAGYVVSGKLRVTFVGKNGALETAQLLPGDSYHFAPGVIHQEEAVEDTVIIEASTPHLNDRVRVEHEYGLDATGGLPTTSEDQIEML